MRWAKSHPVIAFLLGAWILLWVVTLPLTDAAESDVGFIIFGISVMTIIGTVAAWIFTLISNATIGRGKQNRADPVNAQRRGTSAGTFTHHATPVTAIRSEIQGANAEQTIQPPLNHLMPLAPTISPAPPAGANQQSRSWHHHSTPQPSPSYPPKVEQLRGGNVTLKEILKYTPTEFEEFCARALNAMGYKDMKRNGGAGDLQADIVGKDSHGRSTIVQCKRYKPGSRIGTPVIQTFIGMKSVHHQADRGIFMTTAEYSAPAIKLAQQHDIVLIDGDDLVKIAGLVFAPRVAARPEYRVRFCTNCGSEVESHEINFCAECGSPIRR